MKKIIFGLFSLFIPWLVIVAFFTTLTAGLPPPTIDGGTSGGVDVEDDEAMEFGDSTDSIIEYNSSQTPDSLVVTTGTDSRNLIICEEGDEGTDFSHAQSTNPQLIIHSSDATDTTDWGSFYHDQTDANIKIGNGNLKANYSDGAGAFWKTRYIGSESLGQSATVTAVGNVPAMFWYLNAVDEYVYFGFNTEDWDGNSDIVVILVYYQTGAYLDCDLELMCSYLAEHDTSIKTQTRTIDDTTGAAGNKIYFAYFVLNWDETDNNIEVGDWVGCQMDMANVVGCTGVWVKGFIIRYRSSDASPGYTAFPAEG